MDRRPVRMKPDPKAGLTLIEVLVSVAIIAIIATVVITIALTMGSVTVKAEDLNTATEQITDHIALDPNTATTSDFNITLDDGTVIAAQESTYTTADGNTSISTFRHRE